MTDAPRCKHCGGPIITDARRRRFAREYCDKVCSRKAFYERNKERLKAKRKKGT